MHLPAKPTSGADLTLLNSTVGFYKLTSKWIKICIKLEASTYIHRTQQYSQQQFSASTHVVFCLNISPLALSEIFGAPVK